MVSSTCITLERLGLARKRPGRCASRHRGGLVRAPYGCLGDSFREESGLDRSPRFHPLCGHWPGWVIWGPQFWVDYPVMLSPFSWRSHSFQALLGYRRKISLSWLVLLLNYFRAKDSLLDRALLRAFVLDTKEKLRRPCPWVFAVLAREQSHR